MSRRGKIVAKIVLREYKIEVPVKLCKDDNAYGSGKVYFSAEIDGVSFSDAIYENIEKEIRKYARERYAAEWKPLIKITTQATPGERYSTALEFSFDRFYYSKIGNAFHEVSWDLYTRAMDPNDDFWDEGAILMNSRLWYRAKGESGVPEDDLDTKHIRTQHDNKDEHIVKEITGTYYRPYTEELWRGLCQLRDMVSSASMRLAAILGSDEGRARIAKGATMNLLTEDAGEKSERES